MNKKMRNKLLQNIYHILYIFISLIITPFTFAATNPASKEYVDNKDRILQSQITALKNSGGRGPAGPVGPRGPAGAQIPFSLTVYNPAGSNGTPGSWDIGGWVPFPLQLVASSINYNNGDWSLTTTSFPNDTITINTNGLYMISISTGGNEACQDGNMPAITLKYNGSTANFTTTSGTQCAGATIVSYIQCAANDTIIFMGRIATARPFYSGEQQQNQYVIQRIM